MKFQPFAATTAATTKDRTGASASRALPVVVAASVPNADTRRVLRNTYALLSMTLLFSAGVASASVALRWPTPGLLLTLVGCFGLLFAVHRL